MKVFKDNKNREWLIEINISSIKRVRALTGTDLLEAVKDQNFFEEHILNIIKAIDIVYALIKPQADEKNVSDTEFGEALVGDYVDDAINAFVEEFINFFPSRKRDSLQKAFAKIRSLEKRTEEMAEKLIDEVSFDKEIDALYGNLSMAPPELQELTPDPSP